MLTAHRVVALIRLKDAPHVTVQSAQRTPWRPWNKGLSAKLATSAAVIMEGGARATATAIGHSQPQQSATATAAVSRLPQDY